MILIWLTACGPSHDKFSLPVGLLNSDLSPRLFSSCLEIQPGKAWDHRNFLRRGWSPPEGEAAWISDNIARCLLFTPDPFNSLIYIEARGLPGLIPAQTLKLTLNDSPLGECQLTGEFKMFKFNVDRKMFHQDWNILTLETSRLDRPSTLNLGPDNRKLGAFIKRIQCRSAEFPEISFPASQREISLNSAKSEVLIPPMGVYSAILWPENGIQYQLGYHAQFEQRSSIEIRFIQDPDQVVFSQQFPCGNRIRYFQGTVPCRGDSPVEFKIVNTGPEPVLVKGFLSPVSVQDSEPVILSAAFDFKESVIIIAPDACSARSLGSYGNPSAYTGFWDSLARSGYQWMNAYSSASYTVTSVAGILTGKSAGIHGVCGIGDKLDPATETLAEQFHAAGYRTICFSAMPTVSEKWGFAKGFDAFYELFHNSDDPINTKDILNTIQEKLPADKPLFCYIHLREPHAPYHPQEPFCKLVGTAPLEFGTISALEAMDSQRLSQTDTQVLFAKRLYQQQIAALDRNLEKLIRIIVSGTQGPIRIILMSDHGEAFGQHQRMTHNSTVYSEMIHVPFIDWKPESTLPGKLESSFIMNSMLMRLTKSETQGISEVYHRSAGDQHFQQGTIWKNWHFIEGGYYPSREIYNLDTDPSESINLFLEKPILAEWLHRRHAHDFFCRRGSVDTPKDADLIKQLTALGYIQ